MAYNVKIYPRILNTIFDIKGSTSDVRAHLKDHIYSFPTKPNSYISQGDWKVFYVGLNHWILMAPIDDEQELTVSLKPEDAPASVSIVLISDTLTFFHLDGPDAFSIMSIACPLNLNNDAFTEESVTFSEIFGLKGLIFRDGHGFKFAVDQSFGEMISQYLNLTLAD
tara:strand:+ start:1845 stop:2345 length:501 start_codon:yes stop_codon:yes gene_type:complete